METVRIQLEIYYTNLVSIFYDDLFTKQYFEKSNWPLSTTLYCFRLHTMGVFVFLTADKLSPFGVVVSGTYDSRPLSVFWLDNNSTNPILVVGIVAKTSGTLLGMYTRHLVF